TPACIGIVVSQTRMNPRILRFAFIANCVAQRESILRACMREFLLEPILLSHYLATDQGVEASHTSPSLWIAMDQLDNQPSSINHAGRAHTLPYPFSLARFPSLASGGR